MFCNNCGKEIDENAVVCPYCGSATEKMAEVTGNTPNPTEAKKINVYAIVGFVLSFIAWPCAFISDYVFLVVSICAISLGVTGLMNANKKNQNLKGLAIASIVLGALNVVLGIIIIALVATGVIKVIG